MPSFLPWPTTVEPGSTWIVSAFWLGFVTTESFGTVCVLAAVLFFSTSGVRLTELSAASRNATASAEKTLFYQVAVTAAVAPLLSLGWGESWSLHYSGYAWLSIALQTVIGAFASYLAWMWMLRHYPATQLSSFTFLAPLFALVFGVVLLGEHLTLQLLVALAAVAAGIVLVNRKKAVRAA